MYFNQLLTIVILLAGSLNLDRQAQNQPTRSEPFEAIYGSRGVVVYKNEDRNHHKNIILLNANGTVFASISLGEGFIKFGQYKVGLSGADLAAASLNTNYQFDPQGFYPDYGVVQFAYKLVSAGRVEVYINKQRTLTKFIKLDSTLFDIEDWRTHLSGAALEVDNSTNPLKEKPGDAASIKRISVPDDISFRITKFDGSWAQIECFNFCESVCDKKYKGWIRWTNGKQPLLKLYYAC